MFVSFENRPQFDHEQTVLKMNILMLFLILLTILIVYLVNDTIKLEDQDEIDNLLKMEASWNRTFIVDVLSVPYTGEESCDQVQGDNNLTYVPLFTYNWPGVQESCVCDHDSQDDKQWIRMRRRDKCDSICTLVKPIPPVSTSNFSGRAICAAKSNLTFRAA